MTPSLIVLCTPNDKPPRLSTFRASQHRAPPSPRCMQRQRTHHNTMPLCQRESNKPQKQSQKATSAFPSQDGRVHWHLAMALPLQLHQEMPLPLQACSCVRTYKRARARMRYSAGRERERGPKIFNVGVGSKQEAVGSHRANLAIVIYP